jgi:hypothetical protein
VWYAVTGRGGAKIKLRFFLSVLAIGSSLLTEGWAQRKGTAKRTSPTVLSMRSETAGSLSVSFTGAPDGARLTGSTTQGTLDLGAASFAGGAFTPNVSVQKLSGRFVVSTRFAMTLQDASQRVSTATVTAALALPEPLFTLRLDGVKLGPVPQMIQGQARVGATSSHRLEIEVPSSVTEKNSQLQNAIVFQVIAN